MMSQSGNSGMVSLKKHRQAFPNHGGEISPRMKYLMRLICEGKFSWFDWKEKKTEDTVDKTDKSQLWLKKHKKKIKGR